jgi:uncharacterized peroxidase-related enzyme
MAGIEPVSIEQLAKDLPGLFATLTTRYGRIPNFFAMMAHRPAVVQHFLALYPAIMYEGTVEPRYKELAYLKASLGNSCLYCTRAHTATAKRLGIPDEQLSALCSQHSEAFDAKEKATLRYAEYMTQNVSAIPASVLAELQLYYNTEQIIELTLAICMANFTNRFNNALHIEPDLG